MGHVNANVINDAFRLYDDDVAGGIASQTPLAAVDTNWTQSVGVKFHVAMLVTETAGGSANNYNYSLEYNLNGGGWADLTTTTPIQAVVADNCTSADNVSYGTTALTTGATIQATEYCNNGDAAANTSLSSSSFEKTSCLRIDGAQVSNNDTIQLRLTNNGTPLDADTTIPTITVDEAIAQTITGAAFSDPDSYGSGSVSLLYSVTGVAFADPDSYGAGTIVIDQTITGVAFVDPDSYGSGALGLSYTITGVTFADPDAFGGGDISAPEPVFLRPDADDSNAGWINEVGGSTNLWQSVDEASPGSDADYVESPKSPSGEVLRLRLSDPSGSLDDAEPQRVRYRYGKDSAGETINVTVRLMENAAQIASWSHNDVGVGFTAAEQTLTAPQVAAITNYANLFIEMEATAV